MNDLFGFDDDDERYHRNRYSNARSKAKLAGREFLTTFEEWRARARPRRGPSLKPAGLDARGERMWRAFQMQRSNSKRRHIAFLLTFEEFRDFWLTDDRWSRRGWKRGGARRDGLLMARYGDVGPYSLDNIYCASSSQNVSDAWKFEGEERRRAADSAWRKNLRIGQQRRFLDETCQARALRRANHSRAKPVITPLGRFVSAAAAAGAHGIDYEAATARARRQALGWRYEADCPIR